VARAERHYRQPAGTDRAALRVDDTGGTDHMRSDDMGTDDMGSRTGARRAWVLAAVAATTLVAGACGSKDEPAPTSTTAASASSGTTDETLAPGTTSTTAKTSGTTPGTTKTNGTTPPGTDVGVPNESIEADEVAEDVTWVLNAAEYQGRDGLLVAYDCAPDGVVATVWGDGIYTDDSSVCSAAVHAGLITSAGGGHVVIEIGPGYDTYEGSTANGVTTLPYASWPGSFTFPGI
jgi:hypothetical protein